LNDDNGTATFQTQKDSYHKRELVASKIQLVDEKQKPLVAGNFSIAITNDKEVVIDTTTSILSDILLRSELRGHIDNPEYYFQKGNKDAEQAADLLMKINGWTRYAIPDIIQGKLSYPTIPFEQSQEISGTIKSGLLLKPAKNVGVSLVSLNSGFLDEAKTDENGHYVFRNFEFPDSTRYVVQAMNSKGKGKQLAELNIYKDIFPGIHTQWTEPIFKKEKTDSVFLDYVAKADQQYTYKHGIRLINLPEVKVMGTNKKSSYNSLADHYFSAEDIKRLGITNSIDLISKAPGVLLPGRLKSNEQSLALSPAEMDIMFFNELNMINLQNADGVSVSSVGGNYIISVSYKNSISLPANIKFERPLGYQLPIEFYSPKYDTQEKIDDSKPDLRTTIYWKPNVLTDNEGNAKLDFYTADDPGTYSVIIEGVSEDGKLIHYLGRAAITVVSGK